MMAKGRPCLFPRLLTAPHGSYNATADALARSSPCPAEQDSSSFRHAKDQIRRRLRAHARPAWEVAHCPGMLTGSVVASRQEGHDDLRVLCLERKRFHELLVSGEATDAEVHQSRLVGRVSNWDCREAAQSVEDDGHGDPLQQPLYATGEEDCSKSDGVGGERRGGIKRADAVAVERGGWEWCRGQHRTVSSWLGVPTPTTRVNLNLLLKEITRLT